ncbi:hypothetical protein HG536_0E02710 [Torulaspora globosa]|uniref:Uncharacterized protein n=1 Tax=Torulaspora globosa TaxID=48254 RepID=A0A7G3ZIM4_9SACH|nr:uncharacterized protein HG536_0E02710 [Torulaspora globosa]QLL33360.1 hypothetical protein HG536_0E02710 [Torulaspora globosa]
MHAISQSQISNSRREVAELKEHYERLQKQFDSLSAELDLSLTAKQVMDLHIKRLKEYNELRDAGLRLAQLVADEKRCRMKDVFEEMGYSMKDD